MADLEYALKRLKYAEGVLYRDNLVESSLAQAEKENAKGFECGEQETYDAAVAEVKRKWKAHKVKDKTEDFEGRLKRYLDDCKRNFPRFPDRVEKSIATARSALQEMRDDEDFHGNDSITTFIDEKEAALCDYEDQVANAGIKDEWETLFKSVRNEVGKAESNIPRFMDRAATACEKAEQAIAELDGQMDKFHKLKLEDGKSPCDILDEYREKLDDVSLKIRQEKMTSAIEKEINYPMQTLKQALATLAKLGLYQDRALGEYEKAVQYRNDINVDSAWHGIPVWEEFVSAFDDKAEEFSTALKAEEIKELLKKSTDTPLQLMSQALSCLKSQGTYGDVACGKFGDALDEKLSVIADDRLHGYDAYFAFIDKFEAMEKEFETLFIKEQLKDFLRKEATKANDNLGFAEGYLKGSTSQAMDYYQRSIDYAEEIRANERFGNHPEVVKVLNEYEDKRIAWKAKVDEQLLKAEIKSATENATQNLSHARSYFDSGREGQAMDYFTRAKDYAQEVADNDAFAGRPELDEFFAKFGADAEAFNAYYKEKVLGAKAKSATEGALQVLNSAFGYLKGHEGQALNHYNEALDQKAEISADEELRGMPVVEEFYSAFEEKAKEFVAAYDAQRLDADVRSAKNNTETPVSHAESYFKSAHYGRSLEYIEEARGEIETVEADPRLMAVSSLAELMPVLKERIATFEKTFRDTVLAQELKSASQSALDQLRSSDSYFVGNHDRGISILAESKDAALNIATDPRFTEMPAATEFLETFKNESAELSAKFDAVILSEALRSAKDSCTQPLSWAKTAMGKSPESQVINHFNTAFDALAELEENTQLTQGPRSDEVAAFIAEFKKDLEEAKGEFAEQCLAEELKKAVALPRDLLSHANSYFDSGRIGQGVGYFAEAQDAAGALAIDPTFGKLKQVADFFEEFEAGVNAFKLKHDTYQRTVALNKAQSLVLDNLSHAKTYFDSHRRGQALEYFRSAQDALAEFGLDHSDTEGGKEWVAEREKDLDDFDKMYTDAVFQEDLKKAKSACRDPLSRIQGSIDSQNVNQALRDLEEANDAAETLGQDERFLRSGDVDDFLLSFYADHEALRKKLDAYVDGKQRKERRDSADQLLSHAKSYFKNHQRGRGFQYLYEARDAIAEIEFDANEEDKQFIDTWRASAKDFESECNKIMFEEEVKGMIRLPTELLSQAEFQFSTGAHERSLELLESANEAADALAEPKYLEIDEVKQWFKEWVPKVKEVQAKWDSQLLADEERRATQDAKQYFSNAENSFKQQGNARAIEELQKCKEALDGLKDGQLWRLGSVRTFHEDLTAKVSGFETAFNAAVFDAEAKQLVSKCERELNEATTMLQRHAYQSALESFQVAKEGAQTLSADARFSQHPDVVKFIAASEGQFSTFSKAYAKSQLEDEAKDIVSSIRIELAGYEAMSKRNSMSAALTHLAGARGAAAGTEKNDMLLSLDSVSLAIADLTAAEAQFAQKQLTSDASVMTTNAEKHLKQAEKYEEVGARKKAQTEVREARAVAIESYENHLYQTLDQIKELHEKLASAAENVDVMFDIAGEGQTAGGPDDVTAKNAVSGTVGGLLPHPDLRMKTYTLSTDVSPKIYSEVKELNSIAGRINKLLRAATRTVKELPIDDNKQPFSNVTILRNNSHEISSIEVLMNDIQKKVVRYVEKEVEAVPMAKEVLESIAAFKKDWAETLERWTTTDDLLKRMRSADDYFTYCDKAMQEFRSCLASTGSSGWNFHVSAPMSVPMGELTSKLYDSNVCIEVLKVLDRIRAKVKTVEEKFGQYPGVEAVDARMAALTKEILRDHPRHCIRMLLNVNSNDGRKDFWNSLRRFPKARAAAMEIFELQSNNMFLRRDEERAGAGSKWRMSDPYAGKEVSDAYDEDTTYNLTKLYDWVAPNSPDLPTRPLKSMAGCKLWTDLHKKSAGKIVFSKKFIETTDSKDDAFTTDFTGSDAIYARAYWAHTIAQLALAKKQDSGEAVYGPRFIFRGGNCHWLEMVELVFIDGKEVKRSDQPDGDFSYFRYSGAHNVKDAQMYENKLGTQTDYYAFNQTCRLHVSRPRVTDYEDDWEHASNRLQYALSQLPGGKHTVRIDLCFRLHSGNDNYPAKLEPVFPPRTTTLSHPLATGEFTIDTGAKPIKMGAMFPKRSTSVGGCAAGYEQQILDLLKKSPGWGQRSPKTEVPLYVALEGDWSVSGRKWFRDGDYLVEEPVQYGIGFVAFFYRSPQTGWDKEEIAVFHLAAHTHSQRNQKPAPPFTAISVGNSSTFDVELLNPEELKTFKRCPENLRKGLF